MKLALGTVQFGLDYGVANRHGRIDGSEAEAILKRARAAGMDTLDTAVGYGDSERRLGEIGIGGWHVVTKLPEVDQDVTDVEAWLCAAVEASLERLRADELYGLLLHRPQQLLDQRNGGLYRALQRLRRQGLVRKIGISIYTPSELDALAGHLDLDLVQAPFSIMDRRLLDSGWLGRLVGLGVEVHVRSIFLQGLLLMTAAERPAKFERWAQIWTAWHDWLRAHDLTALQACVGYVLSVPEISRVIVGVDSLAQLQDVISAAESQSVRGVDFLRSADPDPDLLNPARWSTLG